MTYPLNALDRYRARAVAPIIGCAAALAVPAASAQVIGVGQPADFPAPKPVADLVMTFGPVAGFTTAAHAVPEHLVVPFASEVTFEIVGADEGVPDQFAGIDAFQWQGRSPVWIDGCRARFAFDRVGPQVITCDVAGHDRIECPVTVVVLRPDDLVIDARLALAQPLTVDELSPNKDMVDAFFREASIGRLYETGSGFVTSIDTPLAATADVSWNTSNPFWAINDFLLGGDTAALASLVEWRFSQSTPGPRRPGHLLARPKSFVGNAVVTASAPEFSVGDWVIGVGPAAVADHLNLSLYSVRIETDPATQQWFDGQEVVFRASTQPPGFEQYITWIGATKYGDAWPRFGSGATFAVFFDNTYGPHEDGGLWSWTGVRADNAPRGQDLKTPEFAGEDCQFPGVCISPENNCGGVITAVNEAGGNCPGARYFVGNTICLSPCPPPTQNTCPNGIVRVRLVGGCIVTINMNATGLCETCPTGSARTFITDPNW